MNQIVEYTTYVNTRNLLFGGTYDGTTYYSRSRALNIHDFLTSYIQM